MRTLVVAVVLTSWGGAVADVTDLPGLGTSEGEACYAAMWQASEYVSEFRKRGCDVKVQGCPEERAHWCGGPTCDCRYGDPPHSYSGSRCEVRVNSECGDEADEHPEAFGWCWAEYQVVARGANSQAVMGYHNYFAPVAAVSSDPWTYRFSYHSRILGCMTEQATCTVEWDDGFAGAPGIRDLGGVVTPLPKEGGPAGTQPLRSSTSPLHRPDFFSR